MTFEALAAPAFVAADTIFDFSRPAAPVPANQDAPLGAERGRLSLERHGRDLL